MSLFLAAGQWQWHKAALKADLQREFDSFSAEPARPLPAAATDPQALRYRKIVALGRYEPQYQILIDNRTYHEQAGYHVMTPLHVDGSEVRLLVNRGWIPAPGDHRQVPQVPVPAGAVKVFGTAIVPGARFFTLGAEATGTDAAWQSVWQNLDLDRYGKAVGFAVYPIVLQLDPASTAGGFVRDWPLPDARRLVNVGYAFQWWGFAAATMALWLVFSFRRTSMNT